PASRGRRRVPALWRIRRFSQPISAFPPVRRLCARVWAWSWRPPWVLGTVLGTLLPSPIAEIGGVRKRAQGNGRRTPRFCTAERFWLVRPPRRRIAALLLERQHEVARMRIVEHRAGAL